MSSNTTFADNTNEGNDEYDIYNFLEDHRVEKGQSHTHTSMGQGKFAGSFFIRNAELDTFYALYERAVFDDKPLYLIEKHEEIGPMVIDFDFKYEFDVHERLHTYEHIEKIVELYVNEIISLFQIERDDPRLVAFVFEREKCYKAKGITKDGIHIMFPFIISSPEPQYYIRTQLLGKIAPVLANLPVTNVPHDIIDKSVIHSNGWMMFGSRKFKCDPYQMSYIFDGNLQNIALEDYYYGTQDLVRFFSIRNKRPSDVIPIRDEMVSMIEKLSQKKKISTLKTKVGMALNYDMGQMTEIMNILSIERAENYTGWIEVGWALHNIDPNSQDLLDLWIEFSRKSSKFVEGECEKEWEKMKNEGLGIGSLYHWAKIDNYEEYRKIMEKDTNLLLDKTLESITHWDVANVLFKMYKYEFKYSGRNWYMFKNHLWTECNDGMELRQKISTELVNKYMKLISDYNKIASSDNTNITEEEKESFKTKGDKALGLIKNLKTTGFKDNIMKESKELFLDDKFFDKLDTNHYLIGFTNGIFDLQKMELRDGRPDDYVSLSTRIEKIDFSEEHEYWEPLQRFLSTVFIDTEVKNYFLTFLATCLQGINVEQKFRVWTGSGSNGKSMINKLFIGAFGEYTYNLPITLLTQKRAASNAATPDIMGTKSKRYCYLEEPSDGEKINAGLMKNLTGNDIVKGRGMYKEKMEEFMAQFKLSLLCNDIPEVPAHDGGVARRMEIIEFKSKFVDNPREENEFIKDPMLENQLSFWKELFMALLIDVYYAEYKLTFTMRVPEPVMSFTNDFMKQCDGYHEFVADAIEETKNKNDKVDIVELYDEFRLWYMEENNETKVPSKGEFKKYLVKKYKDKISKTKKDIIGFQFRDTYEKQTQGAGGLIRRTNPMDTMNGVIGV
jgi:P4 family phage/plasmid primase-like protien